jgi:PAS domain-containing protein
VPFVRCDAGFKADTKGITTYANDAFVALSGYSAKSWSAQ